MTFSNQMSPLFFIYFFMVLRNKSNVIQLAKKNLNNITKIIFPHFFIRVLYIGLIQLFQAVLYQTCFWVELWFQNAITENLKKLKGVYRLNNNFKYLNNIFILFRTCIVLYVYCIMGLIQLIQAVLFQTCFWVDLQF